MTKTVLIAGASGNFGAQAAEAFAAADWVVRRYRRGTDMAQEAMGADVIVNAMNPPNYHAWDRLIPEITRQAIAAARASGAALIVPGNVYLFGDQPGPWSEVTPHRPVARKGRIRAESEEAYREASRQGVQVIILRAGDFLDPTRDTTVMRMLTLKSLGRGSITALGGADVDRAYAFLPDMARAAVALAERRGTLPAFADVPFPGHRFSMSDLAAGIGRLTGTTPRITQFGWWQLHLMAPFWELARELREMRYLYDTPHSLDGTRFRQLLPGFRDTPLDEVIAAHLPGVNR